MDRSKYLLLFLSMILGILFPFGLLGEERRSGQQFEELFSNSNPDRSGLEVSDYKKLRIWIEHLPAAAVGMRLTQEKLRTRCEFRLKQAGIESAVHKDECLYVKVDLLRDSYSMSVRFLRPVLFRTNQTVYRRNGAETWQREIVGFHGGNARYIVEGLESLLDDFISEYLRTNSR